MPGRNHRGRTGAICASVSLLQWASICHKTGRFRSQRTALLTLRRKCGVPMLLVKLKSGYAVKAGAGHRMAYTTLSDLILGWARFPLPGFTG
ncbi:hypothetical protein BDV09DRAFT_175204 [Aspergillus tetrazonus]